MLRIISWNISYQGKTKHKIAFLKAILGQLHGPAPACIIALQEVTEKARTEIAAGKIFQQHCYSLDYRAPGPLEGKNRALGCLIACTGNLQITKSELIERLPFPERALSAHICHNGFDFEVISFHSLTGVGFKKAKSAQFASLAEYLCLNRDHPLILCCDLNEPKIDHIDPEKIQFFDQKGDRGKAASYILKPEGKHALQDSYRLWLLQNHSTLARITREQAEAVDLLSTPLAVSHVLAGNTKKRYDYILLSPHWQVNNVAYRYEEALQHGSDHSAVVADLLL